MISIFPFALSVVVIIGVELIGIPKDSKRHNIHKIDNTALLVGKFLTPFGFVYLVVALISFYRESVEPTKAEGCARNPEHFNVSHWECSMFSVFSADSLTEIFANNP